MASNISTSNKNSIYKYEAQIVTTFQDDDEPITIEPLMVKTIVIDYNYDDFNFPLIYVTANLRKEYQTKLGANQKIGTVIFTLWKFVENSETPGLKEEVINEECIFFISADKGKNEEDATDPNKTSDRGDDMVIGLIALKHVNAVKSVMNGIIKEGTMSSTLLYLLQGHNLLIEPLENNTKIKNFIIPPLNSLTKTIRYLNNYSTFYNTEYRFFMDFGITYLMGSSGKGVARKGDECNFVKFTIHDYYDEKNMEGMDVDLKDGMYQFNTSATFCALNDSTDSEKSYSAIGGVGTEGDIRTEDTGMRDNKSPIKKKVNNIRLPNNNYTLVDNMISAAANDAVQLTITKNKADSSILVVYRQYYVDCNEVYGEKYSGFYLLSRKREVYVSGENEGLSMSVILSMSRLATQPAQV